MIPREKKPGECDCDWSGSCDEHAFVPPGARSLIEARAHAAGYEAAIRDAWRIVLRQRAAEIERGLMAIDDEDAIERDAAEAAQLRAWAGEP